MTSLAATHRILLALGADRPQRSFSAAIEAAGLTVEPVPNPAEPLADFEEGLEVAVVVLDQACSEAGCQRQLEEIMQRFPLAACVVIGDDPHAVGTKCAGVRYVAEPVHGPILREAVEQALGQFRSKRAEQMYCTVDGEVEHLEEATVRRLYRLTRVLSTGGDLPRIATLAAEAIQELLPARGIQVQLWDPRQSDQSTEVSAGPEMGDELLRMPLESSVGRLGELILSKTDIDGAPLGLSGESILIAIAAPVSTAVEALVQRLDRSRAQEATLLAMARIADMRDNETGKHLSRVSHYSVLIAEGMRDDGYCSDQITSEFLADLFRCAPLHDLGKVAIPDAILLKAGRLSPMEWELMKTHPSVGALILDQLMEENQVLEFVAMGRDIALCHHEKWDGTGYPQGLAAEDIPLSARIVAVADIYDALTSERSYKSAWSHGEALEYLRGLVGTHLDPRVLSAFLDREDRIDAIRIRFADDPVETPVDVRDAA